MGSNGTNFKVNFLKNCSITFFLFLHEASLGWHKQHIISRIWLNHSKGCFLKVKGQIFYIFGLLDHFLKNCSITFFIFLHEASLGWHKQHIISRIWLNHSKGCFLKVKGQNFDIFGLLDHFLKNCSITFFLFLHEASLGWHKQHIISRIWLNHSKGCFLKVKGQNFDIFGLLDHFLKNWQVFFFLFSHELSQGWY